MKEKLVIHVCCAICASEITPFLSLGYEPAIFFSNSNIYDREEYEKRKESVKDLSRKLDIQFFEDEYERSEWQSATAGMENEPEGGKRCAVCFKLRLRRTAGFALEKGIRKITTTLAASPYKDELLIAKIGEEVARENNLVFINPLEGRNKKEAWAKALSVSKEDGYYRQKYCGCEFSARDRFGKN